MPHDPAKSIIFRGALESFGLRMDSGGAGQYRGGLGLERRYLMLAPRRISTRFERTISPAWGLDGGGEGKPGHVLIERADGTTQVALKETLMLKAGDRVRIQTGGGGGYGDPSGASVSAYGTTFVAATFRWKRRARFTVSMHRHLEFSQPWEAPCPSFVTSRLLRKSGRVLQTGI